MAEDATKKAAETPDPLPAGKGLADIVAEFKAKPEKTEKAPKLQIPPNFLKELKGTNENLDKLNETSTKTNKSIDTFYKKFLAFIKDTKDKKESKAVVQEAKKEEVKEKEVVPIRVEQKAEPLTAAPATETSKADDTTGQEAAAALKTKEPQPVSIVKIDDKVLEDLTKLFKTLGLQSKATKAVTEQVTTGGTGDKDSILTKVFGSKLTPLLTGLAGALALAIGSWFDSGPFKGLMKEVGKLGTRIFGTKVLAEASKLFPALVKFIKPIARRLPIIGTIIDFGSAISRIMQGDFIGGVIDLASGVATLVPGIGTAISIGLGFLNAARDLSGQTEDAKAGKASKEGNIFALMTQAAVKFGGKFLPKLKFLPIIGSLFSFASAYNHFKSGKVIQGILDVVAGVAGFFPGVGTVISLLTTGASLIMDLFGEDKAETKDPKDALNIPKSSGGSLLSRLNKFLSDKFKDVMKGALQFLKKLPFVPDFVIEKVSKYLGIDGEGAKAQSYAEVSRDSNLPAPKAGTKDIRTLPPMPDAGYTIESRMDFNAEYNRRQRAGIESGQIQDPAEAAARRASEKLEEMRRVRAQEKIAETPEFINDQVKASKKDLPKARDGGIFTGPVEGYPVELHGTEAVVPLNNTESPKDKIAAVQQNNRFEDPLAGNRQDYSMTRLVGMLKEFISDDRKERYEPEVYEQLKTNLKYFERQLKSQKDLTDEHKEILYKNAVFAHETGMGKDRKFQKQAFSYTPELLSKLKYDKQRINIVNDWKTNKDKNWSEITSVRDNGVAKKARFGGIFSGPEDGYNVTLHGDEAVIPLQADTKSKIPLEAPLTQLPGMPGSNIIEKLEELIQTVKEQAQGQNANNVATVGLNTVSGGSNITNIYQNSSERDIPYVERNKYRQKLIYSRGLI